MTIKIDALFWVVLNKEGKFLASGVCNNNRNQIIIKNYRFPLWQLGQMAEQYEWKFLILDKPLEIDKNIIV